jgi:hypothetical protein
VSTWFTRSDILEIFRDAQDLLVRRYQGFYARYQRDERFDFETFKRDAEYCLYCDGKVEKVVGGYRLCERHAGHRETQLARYNDWKKRRPAA